MKMGVGRSVFGDAGHAGLVALCQGNGFPERAGVAFSLVVEEPFCRRFRDDDFVGAPQHAVGMAGHQFEAEELEKIGIGQEQVFFSEGQALVAEGKGSPAGQSRGRLHERLLPDGVCHRAAGLGGAHLPSLQLALKAEAVRSGRIFVKIVVAEFVLDINEDEQAAGNAHGKAEDADDREARLPGHEPKRNGEVAPEHGR